MRQRLIKKYLPGGMFDGGSGYGTSLTGNDAMSLSGGFGGWVNSGYGNEFKLFCWNE
jgi:hypothetical protein